MTRPITVGVISPSLTTWPLFVAQNLNMFDEVGLTVSVIVTGSSREHLAELISGRIEIGHQLFDHVLRAWSRGQDLVAFLAVDHPVAHLIAQPHIRSFRDLRGQVIGVDATDTGYALLLKHMLSSEGLDSDRELRLMPVGGTQLRFAALKDGRVAATLLEAPGCFIARDLGFNELADSLQYLPAYQGTVEACSKRWSQANGEALERYVSAYLRALAWLHTGTNRGAAIRLLQNSLNVTPAVAEACYSEQIERGRFNPGGELAETDLRATVGLMKGELSGRTVPFNEIWETITVRRTDNPF